jgi:hypothetical protein
VLAFTQLAGGGLPHVTPTHGSPAHSEPLHPNAQAVCAPATHTPDAHVLAAMAMPFAQLAAAQGTSVDV